MGGGRSCLLTANGNDRAPAGGGGGGGGVVVVVVVARAPSGQI